jgi:hypothetical protein
MITNAGHITDREKDAALLALGNALFKTGSLDAEIAKPLAAMVPDESFRVRRSAGRIIHRVVNDLSSLASLNWSALERALDMVGERGPLHEVSSYLRIMQALAIELKRLNLERSNAREIGASGVAQDLVAIIENAERQHPSSVAASLWQAKVVSLNDRQSARAMYAELLSSGFMPSAIQAEIGAATYFNDDEIPAEHFRDGEFSKRLLEALSGHERDCYLVLSVDPLFLRHHGAAWVNLAPYFQLQNIGLLFIVAGDTDEAQAVIREAYQYVRMATSFHGGNPDAFSRSALFVPCSVPSTAADPKTFFACARYLLLPDILAATQRAALVVDVDMALRSDLWPFLKKLGGADFSTPFSKGIHSLFPWRRYMAGTTYFGESTAAANVARNLSRYISRGLGEVDSWTLDQNAMTFAVEKAVEEGARIMDANSLGRPLFQEAIRSMFEKTTLRN